MVLSGLSRLGVVSPAVEAIARPGYVTVPVCGPCPHTHGGVVCTSAGKRPLLGGWQHRREPLSRPDRGALGWGTCGGRGLQRRCFL